MMWNNPKLDLVNINAYGTCIQNLVKFYHFVLKILNGNKILNETKRAACLNETVLLSTRNIEFKVMDMKILTLFFQIFCLFL